MEHLAIDFIENPMTQRVEVHFVNDGHHHMLIAPEDLQLFGNEVYINGLPYRTHHAFSCDVKSARRLWDLCIKEGFRPKNFKNSIVKHLPVPTADSDER